MCVAVRLGDLDDLVDALELLGLSDTHVVGDAVDVAREAEVAQFRSEAARVDDGVLLGEEHSVFTDADLVEDVEGLLADGAAADDEALDVGDVEGADPFGVALVGFGGVAVAVEHVLLGS